MMRAGQPGHPRRPAVRAGRHLERHARRRRRGDRGRPATRGSAPATARGASVRSARPSRRAHPPTRRSRACGGSTCRCASTTSPSCLIIQEDPDGLPHPQRLHPDLGRRPGRAARLAAGRHPLRLRHPDPDRRDHPVHRRPTASRCVLEVESRLAVPLHVGGGYGGDPDWSARRVEGRELRRAGDLRPDRPGRRRPGHVRRASTTSAGRSRATAPRAGASSSTAAIGRHDPTGFTDFFDASRSLRSRSDVSNHRRRN